jgi:hypothetical protein
MLVQEADAIALGYIFRGNVIPGSELDGQVAAQAAAGAGGEVVGEAGHRPRMQVGGVSPTFNPRFPPLSAPGAYSPWVQYSEAAFGLDQICGSVLARDCRDQGRSHKKQTKWLLRCLGAYPGEFYFGPE